MTANLLVISHQPEELKEYLQTAIGTAYTPVSCFYNNNAIDGLMAYKKYRPFLTLIDAALPQLNGCSLTAILKGMPAIPNGAIYVIGNSFMDNVKADAYISRPINKNQFIAQIRDYIEQYQMKIEHSSEIERAKIKQEAILPADINAKNFHVDYIYSPFSGLSGDCLDYWYTNTKQGLYGFIFDCAGHDICSFLQVYEIRALIKSGFKLYQFGKSDLAGILEYANSEIFALHTEEVTAVAAVVFYLDFAQQSLHYCSAGVPSFFVRKTGEQDVHEVKMQNYLLGYEPDIKFDEKVLKLDGIDRIVFSSDGFSELLFLNQKNAKHDDVSAIIIELSK